MAEAVTQSEEWVFGLCQRTFLALWSYVNPRGKGPGKELCDILVVCDPHVIVISVKEIQLSGSADDPVVCRRWRRKAVDASLKQIRGAVRFLDTVDRVTRKDGSAGLPLPPPEARVYHRIAVAFGGEDKVAITPSEAPDDSDYHVFDEQSFDILLSTLDTIADFVAYLQAKEALLHRAAVVINGGEENLLAFYLTEGCSFPDGPTFLLLEDDLWQGLAGRANFKEKLVADEVSYVWDRLIDHFGDDSDSRKRWWIGPGVSEMEVALRTMAREDRYSRRILGGAFRDFLKSTGPGGIRSRRAQGPSGVGYVFFAYDADSSLEDRREELQFRCFAALCGFEHCPAVVGISTNVPGANPRHGYSSDLVALVRRDDKWPAEYLEIGRRCRDELGYFQNPQRTEGFVPRYVGDQPG